MAGLMEIIKEAGIVGCGGAGFPTHAKYSGGPVETIIVNGAECDPLLQTDRYLMRNCARKLIRTADRIKEETGAKEFIIALKAAYTREIESLERAIEELGSSVKLHKLQSFFPAGDEQTIVYEVTGRVVPPAAIPLSVGCVVSNVATIYGIGDAFEGEPFTRKFLTVTGEVAHPTILRVPVGTPVSECIALAGGTHLSRYIVVNGGPMMGKMIPMEEVPNSYVTKTMSGLIVLPEDSAIARRNQVTVKHMINQAKSACIQCSFCSQMCPRALLGHPIRPNKIMRKLSSGTPIGEMLNDPDVRNAALCCECGICEIYACPMGLKPRTVNSMLKKELAKAGIRYQRPEGVEYTARPERGMRKAPTERVASRAGVGAYENLKIDDFFSVNPEEAGCVRLSLRQGIGAPSVPTVKDGDPVKAGERIAACPEKSLGSELHASVSGTVSIDPDGAYIEIRTGKSWSYEKQEP